MRVAVTTPTGHVGQHVVTTLIRAGLRPVVLARDPSRIPAELHDHVEAIPTDLHDQDAVLAATRDVDALYLVAPSILDDDLLEIYDRLGVIAATAITSNGIGRTVFQSSIGAELRHGAGEIDGLARIEERLDATGAPVLHLRCGYFFTNLELDPGALQSGVLTGVLPTTRTMGWVAPRDIAEVAVLRLLGPGWHGRAVQAVHGPADLSWDQVAEILSEVLGRPMRAERISDDELRAGLTGAGMSAAQAEFILGMSTGMREGFTPEQPRTPSTTTPTTLRAWAYDVLRPQLLEATP